MKRKRPPSPDSESTSTDSDSDDPQFEAWYKNAKRKRVAQRTRAQAPEMDALPELTRHERPLSMPPLSRYEVIYHPRLPTQGIRHFTTGAGGRRRPYYEKWDSTEKCLHPGTTSFGLTFSNGNTFTLDYSSQHESRRFQGNYLLSVHPAKLAALRQIVAKICGVSLPDELVNLILVYEWEAMLIELQGEQIIYGGRRRDVNHSTVDEGEPVACSDKTIRGEFLGDIDSDILLDASSLRCLDIIRPFGESGFQELPQRYRRLMKKETETIDLCQSSSLTPSLTDPQASHVMVFDC